jgi:hypothetical protein
MILDNDGNCFLFKKIKKNFQKNLFFIKNPKKILMIIKKKKKFIL